MRDIQGQKLAALTMVARKNSSYIPIFVRGKKGGKNNPNN